MSEDEGTNVDAQTVHSEERADDGSGTEPEADEETDVATGEASEEVQLESELEDALETLEDHDEVDDDIATVREYVEEYEEGIEDLEGRLKRKQADFQNYKKRAKKRQEQLRERATEDLVERLVGVRDDLKRALEEGGDDVDSLRDGLEMTLKEFDRVLEEENVTEIDPEPGSAVDPQRHEVMMNVDSDQPEGTIASVFTPGYEMAGKVIQNAQITVSNGSGDGSESDDSSA